MQQLAREVLESVVGIASSPSVASSWTGRQDYVSGTVGIRGMFTGAVVVHCTSAAARRIAGAIFETAADASTLEDIKDVLGELANILGGHLKGILPGPSSLSLPLTDMNAHSVTQSRAGLEVWLECDGEPIVVRILSKGVEEPTAAEASP